MKRTAWWIVFATGMLMGTGCGDDDDGESSPAGSGGTPAGSSGSAGSAVGGAGGSGGTNGGAGTAGAAGTGGMSGTGGTSGTGGVSGMGGTGGTGGTGSTSGTSGTSGTGGGGPSPECQALDECCEELGSSMYSACKSVVGMDQPATCDSILTTYHQEGYCTGSSSCSELEDCCPELPPGTGWQDTCYYYVDLNHAPQCEYLIGTYQQSGYCN